MSGYLAGGRRIGDVPRTTAATGTDAVVAAIARRSGPPASWWGMVMLIASEGVLLAAFVGTFFYLRFNNHPWPMRGDPEPRVIVPLVLTAILSTTSFLMQGAWRATRHGLLGRTRFLVALAVAIQTAYLVYEVHDYSNQLKKLPIGTDAYSSIHFVLLGADHAHVFVGILFNVWLLWKLARGFTTYRANAVQAVTWYWHFVNVLTWVVVLTLTSAALG